MSSEKPTSTQAKLSTNPEPADSVADFLKALPASIRQQFPDTVARIELNASHLQKTPKSTHELHFERFAHTAITDTDFASPQAVCSLLNILSYKTFHAFFELEAPGLQAQEFFKTINKDIQPTTQAPIPPRAGLVELAEYYKDEALREALEIQQKLVGPGSDKFKEQVFRLRVFLSSFVSVLTWTPINNSYENLSLSYVFGHAPLAIKATDALHTCMVGGVDNPQVKKTDKLDLNVLLDKVKALRTPPEPNSAPAAPKPTPEEPQVSGPKKPRSRAPR